jgi:hypothetical protein
LIHTRYLLKSSHIVYIIDYLLDLQALAVVFLNLYAHLLLIHFSLLLFLAETSEFLARVQLYQAFRRDIYNFRLAILELSRIKIHQELGLGIFHLLQFWFWEVKMWEIVKAEVDLGINIGGVEWVLRYHPLDSQHVEILYIGTCGSLLKPAGSFDLWSRQLLISVPSLLLPLYNALIDLGQWNADSPGLLSLVLRVYTLASLLK